MKVYISGPMRGLPEFNFPAFDAAQRLWESWGYDVFNPASGGFGSGDPSDGSGVTQEEVQAWLREDVSQIASSGIIALLPGWERSEGARFELDVARKLGLYVVDAETAEPISFEERKLGVKGRKLARFDLVPKDVLWEVAEVLGWGATNRGDQERNWELGLVAGDLVAGLFRHVSQWEAGEAVDEETGKSHLSHAICLLMFLRSLEMRGRLVDDRTEPFGPLRSELVA